MRTKVPLTRSGHFLHRGRSLRDPAVLIGCSSKDQRPGALIPELELWDLPVTQSNQRAFHSHSRLLAASRWRSCESVFADVSPPDPPALIHRPCLLSAVCGGFHDAAV